MKQCQARASKKGLFSFRSIFQYSINNDNQVSLDSYVPLCSEKSPEYICIYVYISMICTANYKSTRGGVENIERARF